jgi:hypothetical protein
MRHNSDYRQFVVVFPASCADGSIGVFDVESGYKKMSMATEKASTGRCPTSKRSCACPWILQIDSRKINHTGKTPRDSMQRLGSPLFISKLIFLEHCNCTMVTATADGNLRFWQGQWMPSGAKSLFLRMSGHAAICMLCWRKL